MDLSHDEFCNDSESSKFVYEPVAIAIKNFKIFGLKLYMDEFPSEKRTRLRETDGQYNTEFEQEDQYVSLDNAVGSDMDRETAHLMQQVQILGSHGKQTIKIKIKHNDTLPGPKV